MRKFDSANAATATELEQLLVDYWREVDFNGGRDAARFFAQDCRAEVGEIVFSGHDGVRRYYADRQASIDTEQAGGVRTTRHVYHNLHIALDGADRATLEFLIVTYAAPGSPPLVASTEPVAISDGRWELRRGDDGIWRIFGFFGAPVFVGADPFARKALLGQAGD